ncbi:expansin family protein [Boletus edulis]|nr:expansin family protein [Boletus edulis]
MYFSPSILAASFSLLLPPLVGGAAANTTRSTVAPGNSHSLPESYQFDPRDGWESVIVTNLRYKYRRSALKRPTPRTTTRHSSTKSVFRSVGESLAELTKGIIAIGKPEDVTITWYTGHDLLNPSCWSEPTWSPTDKSFVAALTLEGWLGRPKCFKFIELPTKCIFVRVVDTCAGCEKGSKHVDLTQAAFEELAPLSKGVLTVHMRGASDPTDW